MLSKNNWIKQIKFFQLNAQAAIPTLLGRKLHSSVLAFRNYWNTVEIASLEALLAF